MAANEAFIPTHIADYEGEVVGPVLMEFSCQALLVGQCLMTVGGYIVRGWKLGCGKRARAIRREDGAFERPQPGLIKLIRELLPQQLQPFCTWLPIVTTPPVVDFLVSRHPAQSASV